MVADYLHLSHAQNTGTPFQSPTECRSTTASAQSPRAFHLNQIQISWGFSRAAAWVQLFEFRSHYCKDLCATETGYLFLFPTVSPPHTSHIPWCHRDRTTFPLQKRRTEGLQHWVIMAGRKRPPKDVKGKLGFLWPGSSQNLNQLMMKLACC